MSESSSLPAVVILTGLSGAGKSTALRVLEDLGFFCVDGLPAAMVPKLAMLFANQQNAGSHRGLALGLDLRQPDFPLEWEKAEAELRSHGVIPQIIFLEASADVLVRRYAATRRPHPLQTDNLGLEQAIDKERHLLMPVRALADVVIDTSHFSIHDLRRRLQEKWEGIEGQRPGLRVHLISFGFKYGSPNEADLVFDMRFLPNPYFVESMRKRTGKEADVAAYVLDNDVGRAFLPRFLEFIAFQLPLFAAEGRRRLTVAIGCTGGMHRSVAVSEALFDSLKKSGYVVTIEHRHVELG